MNLIADLQHFRTIGDVSADLVVSKLAATSDMSAMRVFMGQLTDFKDFSINHFPEVVQDFILQNQIPSDLDFTKIQIATEFYAQNQNLIGLCLGCYSLPFCYLGADGARVLMMTERIKKDSFQRFLETGEFVNGVLRFEDWQNGNQVVRISKIRLMHAMVRYFVLHSKQWDMAWGMPVNQEDMAGTNLAFSIMVLRGLRKMGLKISPKVEDAYLYLWHVVGQMNGLVAELNPLELPACRRLGDSIAKHTFASSEQGRSLTASLVDSLRKFQTNVLLKDLPVAQMRFFLGDKYANWLNVPATSIEMPLVRLGNNINAVYQQFKSINN